MHGRRRSLLASAIVLGALALIGWIDYSLLIRDPNELRQQTKRVLDRILSQYQPSFDSIEIDLPRTATLRGLALHQPGKQESFFSAAEVELRFRWFWPTHITVRRAVVRTSLDSDDFNKQDSPSPQLSFELDPALIRSRTLFSFRDSDLIVEDRATGARHLLRIERLDAQVREQLEIKVEGQAGYGLIVAVGEEGFREAKEDSSLAPGRRRLPVVSGLSFEIERRKNGDIFGRAKAARIEVVEAVGQAIPTWPREKIWDQIGPGGLIRGEATFAITEGSPNFHVVFDAINAHGKLKDFPYPLTGIKGRFTITPGVLVSWDDVHGQSRGGGEVRTRGTVYTGNKSEAITIHSFSEFSNVPVDDEMYEAIRLANDGAYRAVKTFEPRGVMNGRVTIVSDNTKAPPSISVELDKLDGELNAVYAGFPIPAENFRGKFRLMEGGVAIFDDLRFEVAGAPAKISGRVLSGDMVYLDIQAKGVPFKSRLLALMPQGVQDYVRPLGPRRGSLDAQVIVRRAQPGTKAKLDVELNIHDMDLVPEPVPHPIRINGKSHIALRYPPGTGEDEEVDPDVTINLAVEINSQSLVAAVVSGSLNLRGSPAKSPDESSFDSDLRVSIRRARLDDEFLRKLPREAQEVIAMFDPKGELLELEARVQGLDKLTVSAKAENLSARYEGFQYRVQPERFALEMDGGRIRIKEAAGRTPGGGQFRVSGALLLPPKASGDSAPGNRTPTLSLQIEGKELLIDEQLIQALPASIRDSLTKLDPRGRGSGKLKLVMAPGLGGDPIITGPIQVRRLDLAPLALLPKDEQFSSRRLRNLTGELELRESELIIKQARGRFLDSTLSCSGRIDLRPKGRPDIAFAVRLDDLLIGPSLKDNVPAIARQALSDYRPAGRADVELGIVGSLGKEGRQFDIQTRIIPKSLRIAPQIIGLPIQNLRGTVDIRAGALNLLDVEGDIDGSPLLIRRSLDEERQGPAGQLQLLTQLKDFRFQPRVVSRLPTALRSLIDALSPKGAMDFTGVFAIPDSPGKTRWLGELRAKKLNITAGLTLEEIDGVVGFDGVISKQGGVRFDGGVELQSLSWLMQPLRRLRGRMSFDGSQLSLRNISGEIYGGRLSGYTQYDQRDGSSRGRFDLNDLSFASLAEGLGRIGEEGKKSPSKPLPAQPLTGRAGAWLQFAIEPSENRRVGFGEIRIRDSNLITVPLVIRLTQLLRLRGTKTTGFNRILMRYHFEGKGGFESMVIDEGLLSSPTLELEVGGRVWFAGPKRGKLDLFFLPRDPTDRIGRVKLLTRLLKYQITSLRAEGPIGNPRVTWIPLRSVFDVLEGLGRRTARSFGVDGRLRTKEGIKLRKPAAAEPGPSKPVVSARKPITKAKARPAPALPGRSAPPKTSSGGRPHPQPPQAQKKRP